ncbi:sigma-70 family RNA polymerase sigma factor [Brevibacillus sp. B_LB10_24]|uniref:sigma-70 family RNA polymerase sigma factor n=1 Tax=Brevibacillus sp. B_LB10_24 TaxID=3380645 RepID=UPI0038BD183E
MGIDQRATSKEGLEALMDAGPELFIFRSQDHHIYHPKNYVFIGDSHSRVIIGSSNFTFAGLFQNVESSVLLDLDMSAEEDCLFLAEIMDGFEAVRKEDSEHVWPVSLALINQLYEAGIIPSEDDRIKADERSITLPALNQTPVEEKPVENQLDNNMNLEWSRDEKFNLETYRTVFAVAQVLLEHPAGLHYREIIDTIQAEYDFRESSIRQELYLNDFFESVDKKGSWIINKKGWEAYHQRFEKNIDKLKPLREVFRRRAINAGKRQLRLTNEDYRRLDKEKFIETAMKYYAYVMYKFAHRHKTYSITLEDQYQSAYEVFYKIYDKYTADDGKSFNRFFVVNYLAKVLRNKREKHLIRTPVYQFDNFEKQDRVIEEQLLQGMVDEIRSIVNNPEYLQWKTDYISFEQLYSFEQMDCIEYEESRAYLYTYFHQPHLLHTEDRYYRSMSIDNIAEPEHTSNDKLLVTDHYDYESEQILNDLWNHLDNQRRVNIPRSEVLKYRFGMHPDDYGKIYTLDEIGEIYGVTRERVRQIEARALEVLKNYLAGKGLTLVELLP